MVQLVDGSGNSDTEKDSFGRGKVHVSYTALLLHTPAVVTASYLLEY